MRNEDLNPIIGAAGGLDDHILEIIAIEDAPALWAVRFEHLDILVTNLPEEELIGFSAIIDVPETVDRLSLYTAMLAANGLWRTSGGLRFALRPDNGGVELSMILAAVDLTPRLIADCCVALAGHTASWALLLAGNLPAPDSAATPPEFDPSLMRL